MVFVGWRVSTATDGGSGDSTQFAQLELFEDLRRREDHRVDEAGHREGSTDDGAHLTQEKRTSHRNKCDLALPIH